MLWNIFTATSSGFTGGYLEKDTVFLLNNLFIFDGVTPVQPPIHTNFNTTDNIVRVYASPADRGYNDVGFANIAGINAVDFDLINPESPAVDRGAVIADNELDYADRVRPNGNGPDIGAFEFYRKPFILPAINLLLLDEK